jgi:hypothetical protein
MNSIASPEIDLSIREICDLNWSAASSETLTGVAWAYYHFSIQFRENLQIARSLLPDDPKLQQLEKEECDTDNLSPWPGVAKLGEHMNHDEFMRRSLELCPISPMKQAFYAACGATYLKIVRAMPRTARAASIGSYEGGGLEAIFRAFLTAPDWEGMMLEAFRHFVIQHIQFDSDAEHGHSALSRNLVPDRHTALFWKHFRDLLLLCAPQLSGHPELSLQAAVPDLHVGAQRLY